MDTPPTTIDLKRLAAEVSVQHGIRVDPDDPMMAVVTLNRLVFEQAIAQVLERVQAAVRDFDTAAEKVQVRPTIRRPKIRKSQRLNTFQPTMASFYRFPKSSLSSFAKSASAAREPTKPPAGGLPKA